jgi:TRAP-type C4-dicarboxylate transport system permease large subunit
MIEALAGLAIMMLITLVRIPIAFSMTIVGIVGYAYMRDWNWMVTIAIVQTKLYETGRNYILAVVPLFILMGALVTRSGMSRELFRAAHSFVGHRRGGLAMAAIAACAGFGAICGSSVATAATMAKVAYPSMKRFGYSDELSTGAIAAGGTLGLIIPPSTLMVIYGIMTETNIGQLFIAGILPGLLATILLCGAVCWTTWRDPAAGPAGPRQGWGERLAALKGVGWFLAIAAALVLTVALGWLDQAIAGMLGVAAVVALALLIRGVVSVIALFVLVMGGIYGGIFTATEAAGIGAFCALIFCLARGTLDWRGFYAVLTEAARTTAMLFFILIGALIFAEFVNLTTMPADLKALVERFALHPIEVIAAICLIYVILGTAMEEMSMVLLTLPIFFPIVTHLGFDPVWFGILIVVVVEIGLISPPVGMNLFVLKTLIPDVPTRTIFRGVLPFVAADCVRLALLVAFPAISLFLPGLMK